MGERPVRLVLCDGNRILCEALACLFQSRGHEVEAIATSATDSVAAVAEHRPDACLMDLRFPDGSGLDAIRAIRCRAPDTKILVLSCLADPAVLAEAKKTGVAGFLRKDQKPDSVARALEAVVAGRTAFDPRVACQPGHRMEAGPHEDRLAALTPRESEVLRRIVAGQSTRQMAREMDVAISTVRGYVKAILTKLGAHSRLQAAAIASGHQYRTVA
jgi:two-component system, NarL family, nitrate/nitrite response regulator NarL